MRGGARPGAGRPKGSTGPAKAKRKVPVKAERAIIVAEGKAPLDVLLFGMEYHLSEMQELQQLPVIPEELVKRKAEVRSAMAAAGEFANKAAPYVHPRLTAVEATGKGGEPLIPADAATHRSLAMAILALLRGSAVPETEAEQPAETAH